MTDPSAIEILGTLLFVLAVLHTFSIKFFRHLALRFPEGSVQENLLHLLGEVEIVFGFWAGALVVGIGILHGGAEAVQFVQGTNFKEPAFVFAIMAMAATRPILELATALISHLSRLAPVAREAVFYGVTLTLGPLLGSFITEPAAMTVTALILRDRFFGRQLSDRFMYGTLGALFVNVSIGGVLTPYAAPPVLMVVGPWNWDFSYMLGHFGWKASIAVVLNTFLVTALFWKQLTKLSPGQSPDQIAKSPLWLRVLHLIFLGLVVRTSQYPAVFMGIFLFFLGLTTITKEFQEELKLKESLLVGFFLAGLVTLGGLQQWWLDPLIRNLDTVQLFWALPF